MLNLSRIEVHVVAYAEVYCSKTEGKTSRSKQERIDMYTLSNVK